ncbi:MAG: hypothetical protein U9P11_02690 [Pseudomonadota bacterium]|nr:hypothetical protein [Pseudomonadota bacterium]
MLEKSGVCVYTNFSGFDGRISHMIHEMVPPPGLTPVDPGQGSPTGHLSHAALSETVFGIHRAKAAFFSVSHPATAPAGINRIGHGEGHLATDERGGHGYRPRRISTDGLSPGRALGGGHPRR